MARKIEQSMNKTEMRMLKLMCGKRKTIKEVGECEIVNSLLILTIVYLAHGKKEPLLETKTRPSHTGLNYTDTPNNMVHHIHVLPIVNKYWSSITR